MVAVEIIKSVEYQGVEYHEGDILTLDAETANGLIMRDLATKAKVPE